MTQTAGVGGANGIWATSNNDLVSSLTPEGVLLYCQTRLNDLGKQVKERMARQGVSVELSKCMGTILAYIPKKTPEGGCARHDQRLAAELDRAIGLMKQQGMDPSNLETVLKNVQNPDHFILRDGLLNQEECDKFRAMVESSSSEVNGSMELDMIQLQSVVQQRQMAIQLATNLLNSINEGPKAVVQNIRG